MLLLNSQNETSTLKSHAQLCVRITIFCFAWKPCSENFTLFLFFIDQSACGHLPKTVKVQPWPSKCLRVKNIWGCSEVSAGTWAALWLCNLWTGVFVRLVLPSDLRSWCKNTSFRLLSFWGAFLSCFWLTAAAYWL